ncbi:MAG: hypothetical protein QOC63_3832, partial [Mycobacterium sp.]|nr:hypothetical protein [Mycobacterium sp.]
IGASTTGLRSAMGPIRRGAGSVRTLMT